MQLAEWNTEISYILTIYKYLLGALGLWVLNEKNFFSRIRWFTSVIIELSTTITLSLEIMRHCRGPDDTVEAFVSMCSSVTSIVKLLLHRLNWRYKLILIETIINDWTFVKSSYLRDIMLRYARMGRLGSSVFFYLGGVTCVCFFFSVIYANSYSLWTSKDLIHNGTSERKLIYATYCVFGNYTSYRYGFIEILQVLQVLVNVISHCGNDGFVFDTTMHVCGQFKILRVNFSQIKDKDLLNKKNLRILLKKHHHLIYVAHNLQTAFSFVMLTQVLMSVILLCFEGFQLILTLSMHNNYAATKHFIFISALLVQLFLYCFAGQTLEFQSQGLIFDIYNLPWYNFDVSLVKSLSFMILRASHFHRLTAGKFLPMNFMSFKEILKASASYLSVLRVMIKT